jgi:hypothetical protein
MNEQIEKKRTGPPTKNPEDLIPSFVVRISGITRSELDEAKAVAHKNGIYFSTLLGQMAKCYVENSKG